MFFSAKIVVVNREQLSTSFQCSRCNQEPPEAIGSNRGQLETIGGNRVQLYIIVRNKKQPLAIRGNREQLDAIGPTWTSGRD